MPKLRKEDTEDIDVDALEAAEYSDERFDSYNGEIPPNDTILRAYIKSMWWTRTGSGNAMLKVLVVADENDGDLEEYNGLPAWENMSLTAGAKFKWHPFLTHFGLTIRDVKSKTVVAKEDDDRGAPIEKIADFVPGSDESWCRIIVGRERYADKWQAKVAGWLPYDEDEEPQDADEDEEELDDEQEDEVDEEEGEDEEDEAEDEAEDEPEEVAAPPARGRRQAAAKPAARQAPKTAAKASKAPADTTTRATARKPATTASGPAKASRSRAATPAPAASPRRRGRAAEIDNEPPF